MSQARGPVRGGLLRAEALIEAVACIELKQRHLLAERRGLVPGDTWHDPPVIPWSPPIDTVSAPARKTC
ncbi:hypothetical protein [Rhodococcus sp. APC 3903]|uniref:hypothetical protein n=1 Tax=Rhodococcus sp. APC 3903 TaxID=3035193 RepID=UPI0025B410CE|nr:hypothetical protein [Rhodococcus sp. APC 3903]MDN3459873.1 hypothetical protein [Rhodococcus sp. APC 3903]